MRYGIKSQEAQWWKSTCADHSPKPTNKHSQEQFDGVSLDRHATVTTPHVEKPALTFDGSRHGPPHFCQNNQESPASTSTPTPTPNSQISHGETTTTMPRSILTPAVRTRGSRRWKETSPLVHSLLLSSGQLLTSSASNMLQSTSQEFFQKSSSSFQNTPPVIFSQYQTLFLLKYSRSGRRTSGDAKHKQEDLRMISSSVDRTPQSPRESTK